MNEGVIVRYAPRARVDSLEQLSSSLSMKSPSRLNPTSAARELFCVKRDVTILIQKYFLLGSARDGKRSSGENTQRGVLFSV